MYFVHSDIVYATLRQPAKQIINLSRLTYVSYVVPRQKDLSDRLS